MIACVSIPYFAAAVERRADDSLTRKPLAIGGQPWEARPIYAYSEEVARQGVLPGMSLRLVQVLSPHSHFMPAVQPRYSAVSGELVDVLVDFSPLIEPCEWWHPSGTAVADTAGRGLTCALPACYCLDLTGLPAREATPFIQEMGRSVRRETALHAAIGLARDKFTAQVAASVSRPDHALPVHDAAGFLAERSVRYLPLDRDTARRLRLLGIRTLGQLAELSPTAVHEQFGPEALPLVQLARGTAVDPLNPLPTAGQLTVDRLFEPPVANGETLARVLARLAQEIGAQLAQTHAATRHLSLRLTHADNTYQVHSLPLREPTADPAHIQLTLDDLLAQAGISSAVAGVAVRAADLVPQQAHQLTLFDQDRGRERRNRALQALRQIAARHPADAFLQPVLTDVEHPLPERRFQLESVA